MSKNNARIKFDTDHNKGTSILSKTSTRDKYSSGQTMQHTNRKPAKRITNTELQTLQLGVLVAWCHYHENHEQIEIQIFIQENAFWSVVWTMAAILSRPQCVNGEGHCPPHRRNNKTYGNKSYDDIDFSNNKCKHVFSVGVSLTLGNRSCIA